jgi:hypothetical protein
MGNRIRDNILTSPTQSSHQRRPQRCVSCALSTTASLTKYLQKRGNKGNKEVKSKNVTQCRSSLLETLASNAIVPATLFQTSYELMSMKYGLDAMDISTLASIHISRPARQEFLRDPSQIAQLLTKRRQSYFLYLPARYGHSVCLNDATDCLVSRVRQLLSPNSEVWAKTVLSLYVRALNSLQTAVQCSKLCLEADILCAAGILALYEVC